MSELSATQIHIMERLIAHDFTPVIMPLYPKAIAIRRGAYGALLAPIEGAGFRLLGDPSYLIEGNFSVRVKRGGQDAFVWKSKQVDATSELLAGLQQFAIELAGLLLPVI